VPALVFPTERLMREPFGVYWSHMPTLNEVAHPDPSVAPTPVPGGKGGHPFVTGILLLLLGLAAGGAGVWYLNPPPSAAPQASVSPAPSTVALPSVTALPRAAHASIDLRACASDAECTYEVRMFNEQGFPNTIGTTTGQRGLTPDTIAGGSGWVVFTRPVDGLGGYYLYGDKIRLTYANTGGKIVELHQGLVADIAFSSDYAQAAVVSGAHASGGAAGYELKLWDLATGSNTLTIAVPSTGEGAQAGDPAFSHDGGAVAVAVGYGPDNEHGEIYMMTIGVQPEFKKVADTPRPPQELWWTADGSIVWR